MDDRLQLDYPKDFFNSIERFPYQPNLEDESAEAGFAHKLWWTRYRENYYAYWERQSTAESKPTQQMIGFLAVSAAESDSMEDFYHNLLGSITSPAEDKTHAVARLHGLMGLNRPTRPRRKSTGRPELQNSLKEAYAPEEGASIWQIRFKLMLAKAGAEELSDLGLDRFTAQPIIEKNGRVAYFISLRQLGEGGHPCVKWNARNKTLYYAETSGAGAMVAVGNPYAQSDFLKSLEWVPASKEDLAAIFQSREGAA